MKANDFSFRICLVTVIVMSFIGCKQDNTVPQHLIGVWKTSTPKFEGCYLKFSESFLVFGTADGDGVLHFIRKIESVKLEENKILYTIHYKDQEEEKWVLILTYSLDSGGVIQLKNRTEIWKISNNEELEQ